MPNDDIHKMARYLGPEDPAIRRLLKAAARDPEMTGTVRSLLKRRCVQAGFDPDDPQVFWPVRELKPGFWPLGTVVQGAVAGPIFELPESILTRHLGVFGQAGTGKSFLTMHIVRGAIEAGHRAWILDIEDEYGRLIPLLPEGALVAVAADQLRLNLLQPPGPWVSPASWLDEVELLLRGETFLRDGSLNIFRTGIGDLLKRSRVAAGGSDWPTLRQVIAHFRGTAFGPKSRSAGFVESLLNRLGRLADSYDWTAGVKGSQMLASLAERPVIFRLHTLTGAPLQFLVSFLLLWLSRYREGAPTGDVVHLVVIEEPHMLVSEKARIDIGESAICRTFRTGRKRDLALVLCDQVPSQLPAPILGNLGCRLVMRLVNSQCIRWLQTSMGLDWDQAGALAELGSREAVVQYEEHPTPFQIRVSEIALPDVPDESVLRRSGESVLAETTWTEHVVSPAASGAGHITPTVRGPGEVSGDAHLVMVRICERPTEDIDERCQALRVQRPREFRARGELHGRGLIKEVTQTVGGRTKFFEPTDKGRVWAASHNVRVKRYKSGIVHEYLLTRIERSIGRLGPRWRLKRRSDIAREQGLQPDLLVLGPEHERAIVEVCCSNFAYDADNILAEATIPDVDLVIAVTPDRQAAKRVEVALKKASSPVGQDWAELGIAVLTAAECLADDFDWGSLLTSPEDQETEEQGAP